MTEISLNKSMISLLGITRSGNAMVKLNEDQYVRGIDSFVVSKKNFNKLLTNQNVSISGVLVEHPELKSHLFKVPQF